MFDIRKGECQVANDFRLMFKGHDSDEVTGCAWSKDGLRVVGSWLNGSAYTFNVDQGVYHSSMRLEQAVEAVIDRSVVSSTQSNRFHRFISAAMCCLESVTNCDREVEDFYTEVGRQRFIRRLARMLA